MKKSEKYEKIILLGKSGSGKDFLVRGLAELGLIPGVKTTTRPMRKHEVQNVTYDFVDGAGFSEMLENGEFLFTQSFTVSPEERQQEVWHYGLTKAEFERAQVFIVTPDEFSTIDEKTRKGCFVVYLDIDRDVRESRVMNRQDKNDSVRRRLDADEVDFARPIDYDLRVTDPDFSARDVYDLME